MKRQETTESDGTTACTRRVLSTRAGFRCLATWPGCIAPGVAARVAGRLAVTVAAIAIIGALGMGCASQSRSPLPEIRTGPTVEAKQGMVVSVCPVASEVGAKVLRDGGNAVDAAVATAFALAVTWPEAGNIGGGGFMMIAEPGGGARAPVVSFIDYRETAPASVNANTFAGIRSSHLLAGTPGTVRGLYGAFRTHGSGRVKWIDLIRPAVDLARNGFIVDRALAESLNSGLKNADSLVEFRRVYGKTGGGPWAAGDRLALPDLARTLQRIADNGPDDFYAGETARLIVDEMRAGGGLISSDDLRYYSAKVRLPLVADFHGHTIYAPPPPSSGGVALLQIMMMLDGFNIRAKDRWSVFTVHLIIESMRRAFAERARWLGDPDFGEVPAERLISDDYVRAMTETINPDKASSSAGITPWLPGKFRDFGENTTHFSVIDSAGMAVSNTYTLEQSFGGKIVVRGAGFLLNNELGDFNPQPGVTNSTGQIGTPPNTAAGGKRPLSSMTPVIVAKDGKVFLVTGSPGGRTIINTVTQVVLNRIAFGMSLREAVAAPRLHHQWFPDAIRVEKLFAERHPTTIEGLKQMGHKFDETMPSRQGDAHSIEVKGDGTYIGVADQRIGGAAAGY